MTRSVHKYAVRGSLIIAVKYYAGVLVALNVN